MAPVSEPWDCTYDRSGNGTMACHLPASNNLHTPEADCKWFAEGLPCPSGDHHAYRPPAKVGDPVVVEGTKYRIRTIDAVLWSAKASFGGLTTSGQVAHLTWDRIAGLWRVQARAE